MKARVYFEATSSLTVTIEVPDGLDEEAAKEKAIELAYEEMPGSICAQCGGWGRTWSKDEGEYEVIDDENPVEFLDGAS